VDEVTPQGGPLSPLLSNLVLDDYGQVAPIPRSRWPNPLPKGWGPSRPTLCCSPRAANASKSRTTEKPGDATNRKSMRPIRRRRGDRVRRRAFISALAGAAGWPLFADAQQPERTRRIGALYPFAQDDANSQAFATAFTQALGRLGWVTDKNIRIDSRFAAGDLALFKQYAAELVSLAPDIILASTGPAAFAVREQTRTIPIVFVIVPDPVTLGLVQSVAHPGGNITGFASYDISIVGKWLQLLKGAVPAVTRVSIIFNPDTGFVLPLEREVAAARSFGVTAILAPVRDDAAINEVIAAQASKPGGGLICLPDSFIVVHREVIIAAADRHHLPLISFDRIARAGGLMSYWFDPVELHAEAASYIDRILRGANPGDLPVQYPTKYSLIINLKTAKALGLTVPPTLLDLADEVIE
jgi:putative ABC transport system substrate-binding protein